MVWNAPKTWVTDEVLTAFDLNTYLRDNMLLTCPALATEEGQYFVTAGENIVEARKWAYTNLDAREQTTSTTYTDLTTPGPSVTVTTGAGGAIVFHGAQLGGITSSGVAHVAVEVTGAGASDTDAAASDDRSWSATQTIHTGFSTYFYTGLTPGENTFTLKFRTSAGTATFRNRRILVLPM